MRHVRPLAHLLALALALLAGAALAEHDAASHFADLAATTIAR